MSNNLIILLTIVVFTLDAYSQEPDIMEPQARDRELLVRHKGYSLSYNTSYVQPSWVAFKVLKSQVNTDDKTKPKYKEDPQITTKSASKKDYKEGGYIMAQYVNYLDVKHIPEAVDETFYLSNITPMKLAYYNHIWRKTEDLIRLWTTDTEGLYIICGPILTDSPFPTIGDNNVSVPKRFYKAVYDPKNQKAIGFIFKNGMSSGKLSSYAVSIDNIEKETGIDMFPEIEDELENKIEANLDKAAWDFEALE